MSRLVIVGGSDAGISAGLRARQVDPGVEPLLVVADAFPNYSICGIPYHVSGEVPDWRSLAHRTRADLDAAGLQLTLDTRARHIDPHARTITVTGAGGREEVLPYDNLVIGTGATPVRPPIDGLDELGVSDGVHLLHTMTDTFALTASLASQPATAIIIGAGYIGLEMAEALTARGIEVTVVEQLPQVLGTLDAPLAALVEQELTEHGVTVQTSTTVTHVSKKATALQVIGRQPDGEVSYSADLLLVVVGVRPDTALARTAGVALGVNQAIAVDRRMRTNVPGIYAAGDCVHTYHRLLDTDVYMPLGSTAHKQGRVAGENAAGGERSFAGSLGTQVVKVFDLVAARTGLRDRDAAARNLAARTMFTEADDHKAYYPGARPISIAITGHPGTGQLLGAQLVGHRDTAVAKRVDIYATALHHGASIDQISDLDLSYTPPLGSPWDAVQGAAQRWQTDPVK
jgi:NADPH-dependent 2,4-dienoyl-CoA reductase/sulfur reductase-like enzyme